MSDIVKWAGDIARRFEAEGITQFTGGGYRIRVGPDWVVGGRGGKVFLGPQGLALTFFHFETAQEVMNLAIKQWCQIDSYWMAVGVNMERIQITPLEALRIIEIYKEAVKFETQADVMAWVRSIPEIQE